MTGARGARARRQGIAVAALMLLGAWMLSGCGETEESPTAASATPSSQAEEPTSAEEPPAASDGGEDGEDGSPAPEATEDAEAQDTAWCEVSASDLVVLRSDDGVDCGEVEEIFADVAEWDYPDGGGDTDRQGWDCAIAPGQVPTPSRFTEVPMCAKGDSFLTALPEGSTPLDGYAVDMGTHAFSTDSGVEYSFAVPDSDIVCSIIADGEGRGFAGCHGTFEEGAEAEGPGGMEPANTVEIDETGAGFAAFGDPRYWPLDPEGVSFVEAPELPTGSLLSAYGVVCQSLEAGAVTCTAGEDAVMTVSATEHEFRP